MHQGSPSNAGATRVVFPAPGGAISSARGPSRSAKSKSASTESMGKKEASAASLTDSIDADKARNAMRVSA